MSNPYPVLIAEDNPASRRLLDKLLRKAGYEVTSAENGIVALQKLEKNFFPIIITDWMMPGMDGLELCRVIRRRNWEESIFIIILTSNDSKDEIVAGLEAGADDYLTKPFHRAELMARLNIIKRYLNKERSLKEANEKIKILSITDPLTGIYNRYYLYERLPQEIARAKRYKQPLSLIMCDIDHFKKINDSYGHCSGDLILKGFVNSLKESLREGGDWLVRYGGEEFLLIMPMADLDGACVAAERFRCLVSERFFEIEKGKITISASFGVTCFDPRQYRGNLSSEFFVGKTDKYLYQAKKEGRNRVKGGVLWN